MSGWGITPWGAGGGGGGSDSTPPAVIFTPASSAVLARTAPVGIAVTDNEAVDIVIITAEYPSAGLWEVVFDGTRFSDAYTLGSSVAVILGGYGFVVDRATGWPADLILHVTAVDASGNRTDADAYYTLQAAAVLTVEEVDDDGLPKELEHNPDYVAQGLLRIIEQYKGKPRLAAWITSYLEEIQELEDAMWQVVTERWLEKPDGSPGAVGAQLLVLGRIVGQVNPGLDISDPIERENYRALIRARIKVNRSSGKRGQLIEILRLVVGDDATINYAEYYPARIMLTSVGADADLDMDIVLGLLRDAKAAGVALQLVSTSGAETGFRFGTVANANVANATQGWGDLSGSGGLFAEVRS